MRCCAKGFAMPKGYPKAGVPAGNAVRRNFPGMQRVCGQGHIFVVTETMFRRRIESVENRCMAADGPVTPTSEEITDDELRRIWLAAKAGWEAAR